MSKVLRLYNTFTKTLGNVELSGKLISANDSARLPVNGSFYICGPTVYSDSHVGHAITYIRADLFRRFMRSTFNVDLFTVMNITDIDDKVIEKTKAQFPEQEPFPVNPAEHPFNKISDKYYKSFLVDMKYIKILPADLYMKVSKQMHLIIAFIQKLESNGNAYRTQDGDIRFRTSSVKNYISRKDPRRKGEDFTGDKDPDFVLWKAAKPGEPLWDYQSSIDGSLLRGRPGWHVQCSAISSAIFGNQLDFHFGGKDLIFPHHYNEEACSCAYHLLDTSKSLHVWANHWLHSGHLVLQDRKMSKSLGNVVPIKNVLSRSSLNALRLMCIESHYRSDVEFGEDALDKLKSLDHKLSAFVSYIREHLDRVEECPFRLCTDDVMTNNDLESVIIKTQEEIIDGLCDDFHIDRGLYSILDLAKNVYSRDVNRLKPRDLLMIWSMLRNWSSTCGLDYRGLECVSSEISDEILQKTLSDFRFKVRKIALGGLNSLDATDNFVPDTFKSLLKECDEVRAKMDELGFIIRDPKLKSNSK